MPTETTTVPQQDKGLLSTLMGLLGSAQNSLDHGIKTEVSVVFPSTVYFDIFALVVFCALAVIGLNLAVKKLST